MKRKLTLAAMIKEIKTASTNINIKGYQADFSKLEEVKSMAAKIKADFQSIDVLVNNAGVFKATNPITENGLDIRMVVNYLASYELTQALLPLLQQSSDPRIINLSSEAQATVSPQSLEKNPRLSDNEAHPDAYEDETIDALIVSTEKVLGPLV